MNRSGAYRSWDSMRQRCLNSKDKDYKNYGGRGITICKRRDNYSKFLLDMGERPPGTTLDRKENSKGYFKVNCRWATPRTQANNRRSNHTIKANGFKFTISQWAEKTGINKYVIYQRLETLGWSGEEAVNTPIRPKSRSN